MDLVLNNLQRLICLKTQPTNVLCRQGLKEERNKLVRTTCIFTIIIIDVYSH